MSQAQGMSGEAAAQSEETLVGVCLLSDGTGEQLSALGAIVLSPTSPLSLLRSLISEQIPSHPPNFRFCTHQRWPITNVQESTICLRSLLTVDGSVYIQQTYDQPKIGIKAKTGVPLGFVFSSLQKSLTDFRSHINTEVSFFTGISDTYQFLDGNSWPVSKHLEWETTVSDVLVNSCVVVCTDLVTKSSDLPDDPRDESSSGSPDLPRKKLKLKGLKQLSFLSGKDIERQKDTASVTARAIDVLKAARSTTNTTTCDSSNDQMSLHKSRKQLLISYVRAEAADYALNLKNQLARMGFSVYLDVHEISVGVDWQDSLNFAVSNCEVFIPLVTARYGETLWTNREVKLADVLGKFILPVNFLADWPPRCLAIQFATTQYVVASHPHAQPALNGSSSKGCDVSVVVGCWTEKDIKTTAVEISHRLKTLNKAGATFLSIPSLVRMKTLRKTFVGKLPAVKSFPAEGEGEGDGEMPPSDDRSLIVICLHPSQRAFGKAMKQWLEDKKYTVWLSSDKGFPAEDSDILSTIQSPPSEEQLSGDGNSGVPVESVGQIASFQSVADHAAVVVVLLSQDFAHSHTCKQQLFYCEQRKPLVSVHFEDFTMPGWLSMLIGSEPTESCRITEDNYHQTLLSRLQRVIHSASRSNLELLGNEAKLNHAVEYIRQTAQTDSCVYIAGSTHFHNPKTEEICKAIGVHLARVDGLSVATGGFYGAGHAVSQAFHAETQQETHQDVWHILPDRDGKDWKNQANQNSDGTFAVAPFGKTLFCGDSVRQRESIVGRCFEICILIEGGPSAAHEAEEFVWNDRTVIPVRCTGGAASGKFSAPQKMFETPQGVSSADWQTLTKADLSASQVAQCVARVVSSLLLHLSATRQQVNSPSSSPAPPPDSPSLSTQDKGKKGSPQASVTQLSPVTSRTRSSLNKKKTVILG